MVNIVFIKYALNNGLIQIQDVRTVIMLYIIEPYLDYY